ASGQRVPRWARPSLVIRDGRSMRYQYAGHLQAGDLVYLFVSPRYVRLLDRLFASPAVLKGDDKDFFGEFPIEPDKPLLEIGKAYSMETEVKDPEMTVADFIRYRLGGAVELGDRVSCGDVELVIREMTDDGRIASVGLVTDPGVSASAKIPLFLNAREIFDRLKKVWRAAGD